MAYAIRIIKPDGTIKYRAKETYSESDTLDGALTTNSIPMLKGLYRHELKWATSPFKTVKNATVEVVEVEIVEKRVVAIGDL